MKKRYNRAKYVFSGLVSMILFFSAASCKDKKTLEGAGDDIYITIEPFDNFTMQYGVDTVAMSCVVKNYAGDVISTDVVWSSLDESVVRFLDNSNKAVVDSPDAKGKSTRLRVTLPNGKYAETRVSVSSIKGESVSVVRVDREELKDGEKRLVTSLFEGNEMYIAPDAPYEFAFVSNPVAKAAEGFSFSGFNPEALEIIELTELDAAHLKALPAGGRWFRVTAKEEGDYTLKITVGEGNTAYSSQLTLHAGVVLEDMGLNELANEYEKVIALDVNQELQIPFYLKFSPNTEEALQQLLEQASFAVEGGGGVTIKNISTEYDRGSQPRFIVTVLSGAVAGRSEVVCTLQGKKRRMTASVVDFAAQPVAGVAFRPAVVEELYVGEVMPLRIVVTPASSYTYAVRDFQFSFSTPDLVEVNQSATGYELKGLKAGETDLILRVRGQEARLHITTKAAVKSVLIDNTSENVVMVGDKLVWEANVTMEGTDLPDWSRLQWSLPVSSDTQYVGLLPQGKKVALTAKALPEGVTSHRAVVKAEYRGKDNQRELTIVPLQQSVSYNAADLDMSEEGSAIEQTTDKQITTYLMPNSGIDKPELILQIERKDSSSLSLEEKTYTPAEYKIVVLWSGINLRRAVDAGSLTVTRDGSNKYRLNGTLTINIPGQAPINIQVDATGFQLY